MDFDIVSNCSGYSNQTDELRSNASSLSGLSTYQDEFAELRHLINPVKYPSSPFARCSTPKLHSESELSYDNRISNLSCQLQNSLILNEKYKNDLYNLEKNIELKFYEKIEKLLKINHRLKAELDNANTQIERLLRNFSTKNETSSVVDKNFIQLEKKCHELNLQNSALQCELLESKTQEKEYELQNKQLKTELNELKIDFEAKQGCIKELKEKISQQYVEIERLLKNNLISSQSLDELSSGLKHAKKVQEWYKDQLHLCQKDKKLLSDEVLNCKINFSSQQETIDMLNIELAKWKDKCDLIQFDALKEKENLMKQLESHNFTCRCSNSLPESNFIENNTRCVMNYYETSIQDLTDEIIKIKEYVHEQDKIIKRKSKENSELMASCVTLQKTVRQKEISIEQLENSKHHLNIELTLEKTRIKEKTTALTSLNKQVFSLEAELRVRRDEKETIETAIQTVREQFNLFKSKYNKIEEELLNSNKQILQLQDEKQKLFMSNNWNICELEKMKEKDEVIKNLKYVLSNCEQKIDNHLGEIKRLENELQEKINEIKICEEEKQSIIDNNSLEIQKYEGAFLQYKTMVSNYEKKFNDLQKGIDEKDKSVTDLRDNIKIFKEELNRRDSDLNEMYNKCAALESRIQACDKKIDNKSNHQNLIENNAAFLQTLQQFIKVYKGGIDTNNGTNRETDVDTADILKVIEECMQYNSDHRNTNNTVEDKNLCKVNSSRHMTSNKIVIKVMKLENRIKVLNKKIEDSSRTLKTLSDLKDTNNDQEKINELNVLLQVRELELKEKQKKYETNNRTLLRKVKEHMKGRNSAEKHNKYLQELYNSLSDENSSLKLTVGSKDYEIQNIKKQLENYITINNRLKQSILSLEEKAVRNEKCDTCLDYAAKSKKLEFLEKSIKELESEKAQLQNILMDKENLIVDLKQQNHATLFENSTLVGEKEKHIAKLKELVSEQQNLQNEINSLLNDLKMKQSLEDELQRALEEEEKKYSERNNENLKLKEYIDEMNNKMEYLSGEIKIISSALQNKAEELKELKDKKSKTENNWIERDQTSQNTIITLKNYLRDMQNEVNSTNSEKYFLQRLCNDLKLALRTYVNHNKVLKDKLNSLSQEKHDFNSLPNILPDFSTASKYDDAYINQLLQQHKVPLQDKPLTEIKGCLDTLRKEISTLQDQIAKKNINIS